MGTDWEPPVKPCSGVDPEQGDLFAGRFIVEKKLGAGGMGAVFSARDGQTGEKVALKVLRTEFSADHAVVRRFRRESLILAALTHPAVVRVSNAGSDEAGR